jgi:hypothetical protein
MTAIPAISECLDIASEAKATIVNIDGIGSELAPTLFAWDDTTLLGYAMLTDHPIDVPIATTRLTQAAGLLVTGWHATSLALVLEGYAQPDTVFTHPRNAADLAARFPTDPTITEAIWAAYTNGNDQHCLALRPYRIGIGRTVSYDNTTYDTRTPEHVGDYTTEGTLPHILETALTTLEPTPIPRNATIGSCRQVIAGIIHRLGFSVRLDTPDTNYPDPFTRHAP